MRTAIGVIRGDSAKNIAKSVGMGFLADNVLDGAFEGNAKIQARRANAKAVSTMRLSKYVNLESKSRTGDIIYWGADLNTNLRAFFACKYMKPTFF